MFQGRYWRAYPSDCVYVQTVPLLRSRTGSFEEARTVGDGILGTDDYATALDLRCVGEDTFESVLEVFERHDDHPLSSSDATAVAPVEDRGIDAGLSFDREFDGIVDRMDPADLAG